MEYATRHLYFLYTHEPLGEFVYEESTSDKWHVPQYTNLHIDTSPGPVLESDRDRIKRIS